MLTTTRAAFADPLSVHASGALPFTTGELESALAVRAAVTERASIDASVTGDASSVHVAVLGREREVTLEGASGQDAARLVAFAILDMAGDQLSPPALTAQVAPRSAPTVGYAIALWGAAGSRYEIALELGVQVAGDLRAIASAGASTEQKLTATPTGPLATSAPLTEGLRGFPIRAGLAWRGPQLGPGRIELRATAIALAEHASATITRTDELYGAGAAAAWAIPLFAGATLIAAAGGDAFATQLDYRIDNAHVTTTPRTTWWAGLAISAEVAR
jgi:hypothetical protein